MYWSCRAGHPCARTYERHCLHAQVDVLSLFPPTHATLGSFPPPPPLRHTRCLSHSFSFSAGISISLSLTLSHLLSLSLPHPLSLSLLSWSFSRSLSLLFNFVLTQSLYLTRCLFLSRSLSALTLLVSLLLVVSVIHSLTDASHSFIVSLTRCLSHSFSDSLSLAVSLTLVVWLNLLSHSVSMQSYFSTRYLCGPPRHARCERTAASAVCWSWYLCISHWFLSPALSLSLPVFAICRCRRYADGESEKWQRWGWAPRQPFSNDSRNCRVVMCGREVKRNVCANGMRIHKDIWWGDRTPATGSLGYTPLSITSCTVPWHMPKFSSSGAP